MKYTKAPWFAVEYAGHWDIQDGQYYGDNCIFDEDVVDEAKDNAHLAIKAPEMYEALKWFINSMNDGSLIIFTDDDQSKAVRDNNQDMINKIEVLVKGLKS